MLDHPERYGAMRGPERRRRTATATALVHSQFERMAALSPKLAALRFRDRTLSYGELNRRANQVARLLLERGAGAGARVIVSMEPGLEVSVALLATLKAGAVYVPLDPNLPALRQRAILDDIEPALVLTQSTLLPRLELGDTPALSIDSLPAAEARATRDLGLFIDPERPAYIFYTSGSTGTPKGVIGTHANLSFYIGSARERYGITRSDRMPALARFGFSISLFELLTPLSIGGTSIVLERDHVLDPARLAQTLAESTIVHAGPSLWRNFVAHVRRLGIPPATFAAVRHASSGGDMVPPELLEGLKATFPAAEIFVIYGSSEIACMGTTDLVPRQRHVTKTYVGRPFEGVTLRVLDEQGNRAPLGVVGDVYVAGPGLAQGYFKRPELTAESFVNLGGRRFYRMGDRGRFNRDGQLELLGRSDSQVKIRGMRVELGEVEQHLRAVPGVREAVAAAQPAPDGELALVAYVVFDDPIGDGAGPTASFQQLRAELAARLPDYMLPSTYVELERLPLNHNLKVDRRALPAPTEADRRALAKPAVRDCLRKSEQVLGAVFRELLGLEQVSLDDNFFELGGHSLLAERCCALVRERLGVELDAMALVREPLEVLARRCDQELGVVPLPPSSRRRETPAGEHVELFHFGPGNSLYGVLHGDPSRAKQALLVCGALGHENARTRFVLKQLAKRLAREGIVTLLFDYFGTGDSLGQSDEAGRGRYCQDISHAYRELVRRAAGVPVTALGVRLGALFLCAEAANLPLERIVLWDPVCDGQKHHAELAELQRAYLLSVADLRFSSRRLAMPPENELLGMTYAPEVLAELDELELRPLLTTATAPVRWLATAELEREPELPACLGAASNCRVECLSVDCGWRELETLEDLIPDSEISATLAAFVRGET